MARKASSAEAPAEAVEVAPAVDDAPEAAEAPAEAAEAPAEAVATPEQVRAAEKRREVLEPLPEAERMLAALELERHGLTVRRDADRFKDRVAAIDEQVAYWEARR